MITKIDIPPDNRHEYIGLSTDIPKPDYAGVNSLFLELDTRDIYYFDGSDWQQVPDSGGGGGGGSGGNVPSGGTTGQLLAKASGTNYDTTWVNQFGFNTATITLTAANWSSSLIDVTCSGMTSTAKVWVSPAATDSDMSNYASAQIYCSAQATDTLTFKCIGTTPTSNIDVEVIWA